MELMKARRERMMDEVLIIDSADAPPKRFYDIDEILKPKQQVKHNPLSIDEAQWFWYNPPYRLAMATTINPNLWMEECDEIER